MSHPQQDLRDRTKAFAVRIVRLYRSLPYRTDTQVLGKQLIRCGTAVAANYRAAGRARSRAERVAKIGIVVEEADETVFWLEMLSECEIVPLSKIPVTTGRSPRTDRDLHRIAQNRQIQCRMKLQNYPITKLQDALHHSSAQLLQRIPRPAPDDAVIPQRMAHRKQERIDKQRRADRMQQEIISRNAGTPRHAYINGKHRQQSDSIR
jgi:four helix bundle protein